jgi:multidrug efflux system outer membrane protein
LISGAYTACPACPGEPWSVPWSGKRKRRAELLASQWAQRATRVTLVQDVAQAYFQLRSLDAQLEITRSTIKARQDSLQLTQSLEKYGAGSLADTRQAEELLYGAKANLPGHPPLCHPERSRGIAVQENTISILLGHNPEDIHRGLDVASQPHPQQVPTGVPSRLLQSGRKPP